MAVTTKSIVDSFKTIAEQHSAVNWFDYGTAEFLFDPQVDLKYPAVFLQMTGGQIVEHTREERTFTLYVLAPTPDSFDYTKTDEFDYDNRIVEERDNSLQVIRDIIGRLRINSQRNYIIEEGALVYDNDAFSGAVGWRCDLTIVTVADYDNNNFPE